MTQETKSPIINLLRMVFGSTIKRVIISGRLDRKIVQNVLHQYYDLSNISCMRGIIETKVYRSEEYYTTIKLWNLHIKCEIFVHSLNYSCL